MGMSDRSVADFSLNAWIADAAAVAESVGHPLPVYASGLAGPAAIAFAVHHPDLVSHLILRATGAVGEELTQNPVHRASVAVAEVDFGLCLDVIVRSLLRVQEPAASEAIEILNQEVESEAALAFWAAMSLHDVRDVLAEIEVPTLIVESRQNTATLQLGSRGRELSRHIPGAHLVTPSDRDGTTTNILRFLEADQERSHGAFRTIMFTDLVSSTALTQRVGDDAAQQVVETHDAAVHAALEAHKGVEIKHTGDGIMASFDSVADAARAARQIATVLTSQGVDVRIGLNAGEPIERDGDLFGTAVQLAARVCDAGGNSQVLATQVIRDLTAGKGLNWSPLPPIDAKGFDEPVPVFTLNPG
jgi:class 3 adenylate cyclase